MPKLIKRGDDIAIIETINGTEIPTAIVYDVMAGDVDGYTFTFDNTYVHIKCDCGCGTECKADVWGEDLPDMLRDIGATVIDNRN